jgi:MFS family permease
MPATFDTEEASAVPPDGGYGWVCVVSLFLVNFSTWGAVAVRNHLRSLPHCTDCHPQSFGVYLSYYLRTERYPGATDLEYALVGGFNFAFAMIVAPLVTVLTHRFGKFVTMPVGIAIQTSAYIAAGFVDSIGQLMITQGILVGVGIGFIYVPSLPILSQWFEARRSLANGIASAGSGFGGALFAWTTGAIIDAFGLQWALCATGLITFFLTAIATSLLRDRNKYIRPPQLALDTSLLKKYEVQLLLAWSFVSMLGYITLLFSLSDFALSIGISPQRATDIIGFLNVGTAVGRPIIGVASDKSNRIDVALALTLICGLSCFAFWIPVQSYGLLVFFSLLAGAILGVFWMVNRASRMTSEVLSKLTIQLHRRSAPSASKSPVSRTYSLCFLCHG